MKRSYNDFRRNSGRHDDASDSSSTRMNPVVIEPEGAGESRNYDGYNRKDDARLLNLLIRAVMENRNHFGDDDIIGAKFRVANVTLPRNNSNGTKISTSPSPLLSNTKRKDTANRIPSDDREPSPVSVCTPLRKPSPPLPYGRPLMAPPRLPTDYVPKKARFVTMSSTAMGMAPSCEL